MMIIANKEAQTNNSTVDGVHVGEVGWHPHLWDCIST